MSNGAGAHAFEYSSAGGFQTIDDSPAYQSYALDINDYGDVAGHRTSPGGYPQGVARIAGHWVELGTLGGGYSSAAAINNRCIIVGQSWLPDQSRRAFIYQSGKMKSLSDMVDSPWIIETASDINDRNQIVVEARRSPQSSVEAVLLTPIGGGGGVVRRLPEEQPSNP
jgi:probable HAF family extracellular repeat protein